MQLLAVLCCNPCTSGSQNLARNLGGTITYVHIMLRISLPACASSTTSLQPSSAVQHVRLVDAQVVEACMARLQEQALSAGLQASTTLQFSIPGQALLAAVVMHLPCPLVMHLPRNGPCSK